MLPPPRDIPPRARRPPDYSIAAQLARNRHVAKLGRAHSHEGVTGYYCSDVIDTTDPEDGEEATLRCHPLSSQTILFLCLVC